MVHSHTEPAISQAPKFFQRWLMGEVGWAKSPRELWRLNRWFIGWFLGGGSDSVSPFVAPRPDADESNGLSAVVLEIASLVGWYDKHGVIAQAGGAAAIGRIAVVVSKFRLFQGLLQLLDQLPFFVGPGWNLGQAALVVVDEIIDGAMVVVDDAVDGFGFLHPLTPRLHRWTAARATSLCVISRGGDRLSFPSSAA